MFLGSGPHYYVYVTYDHEKCDNHVFKRHPFYNVATIPKTLLMCVMSLCIKCFYHQRQVMKKILDWQVRFEGQVRN